MRAQRQATWQGWSLAAFQLLAHSRYAGLICHAAQMLRCAGCIQEFTNLFRAFRISSLRPANGYLTLIGIDEPQLSLDDLNRKVGGRLILQKENQQRRTEKWLRRKKF
jgi:hypothetical protein